LSKCSLPILFRQDSIRLLIYWLSHITLVENADVVVRMPCGGGTQAGPFHSQTNEAWFTKPGLKVSCFSL
jgi:hypothetical protein